MTRSELLGFGVALALVCFGAGCGEEGVSHPPASETLSAPDRVASDTLVASGDGIEIGVDEFEHFLQKHPELDKEEALERLIERELLVNEAIERGLHTDPTLDVVRKRAMVRELLRAEVEAEITEDDLTEEEIAKSLEQVRREVGHPPGVRASHLVVLVPPDKQKDASKEQVEAWFETSRIWLDRLRAALPERPDALELSKVAHAYQDKLPEPLKATVNAHMIFPVGQGDKFGADLPETWNRVVPQFRDAAAKLARGGRFGELSEPVKTEFGWHVIVAEEALPGKVGDEEALREVARWRLLRRKRNAHFTGLMKEWAADAQMSTHPEVISEAEALNN